MKTRDAARLAMTVAAILISAMLLSAQDTPMGDVARQARAEKLQAPHSNKVVTNEDLGPQLSPVAETDDPAHVVNKARRAWVADTPRTCPIAPALRLRWPRVPHRFSPLSSPTCETMWLMLTAGRG